MDTMKAKALTAIWKHGSFSGAAEEFSYTPSAFSHMADSLEEELGVKLFSRTRRGVTLTEEGLELLKYFDRLLAAEELLLTKAAELSSRRIVRIGAFASIFKNYLPPIIQQLRALHPHIKLSMTVSDHIKDLFFHGKLDVIISTYREMAGTRWVPLFCEPFVALFPATAPAQHTMEIEQLYAYPYIDTADSGINDLLDMGRFCEVIPFASQDYDTLISMVKAGVGFSILPKMAVAPQQEGVRAVHIPDCFCRTIGVMYKADSLKNKALAQVVDHLCRCKETNAKI